MWLFVLFVSVVVATHTAGVPTSVCVTLSGVASVVDACGVCGGNGTSCQCNGGYLNFSPGDANAGVLCYVDDELSKQVVSTIALLDELTALLVASSCTVSSQLGFGAWNAALNNFCSGSACTAASEPNVFAFLQANIDFGQSITRTLNA